MIAFFNKLGNSWVAKIICAALGISMLAFWGLGGISLSAGSDNTAIRVGAQKMSIQQLNQAFEVKKNQLSQLTGTYISPKQAIDNGLLDQVIQEQTSAMIQSQLQEKIGLTASDEAVRKYVENNPVFKDNLGHFDANLFYAYLGQMKMNQEQLADKLKDELALQHLTNALMKSAPREKRLMTAAAQAQKEKRQVSYYFLKQTEIPVASPSETDLKDYYEAYQEQFTSPEYRKIHLVFIKPENFQGDYDKMYQAVRDLEDLLGGGVALVDASKKLALSYPTELVVDFNGNNKQGVLADKRLKENTLLQEVFVLDENEATSIIEYANGFLVAEVKEIIPSTYIPFNQVKDKVVALYKQEQQKEKLPALQQEITDNLVQKKTWGKHTPKTEVVSRTQASNNIKKYLPDIFAQKTGFASATALPTPNGYFIFVVNQVIADKQVPSKAEQEAAIHVWAQDLIQAVQQNYTKDLKVNVHQDTIKKAFATYLKEEE